MSGRIAAGVLGPRAQLLRRDHGLQERRARRRGHQRGRSSPDEATDPPADADADAPSVGRPDAAPVPTAGSAGAEALPAGPAGRRSGGGGGHSDVRPDVLPPDVRSDTPSDGRPDAASVGPADATAVPASVRGARARRAAERQRQQRQQQHQRQQFISEGRRGNIDISDERRLPKRNFARLVQMRLVRGLDGPVVPPGDGLPVGPGRRLSQRPNVRDGNVLCLSAVDCTTLCLEKKGKLWTALEFRRRRPAAHQMCQ